MYRAKISRLEMFRLEMSRLEMPRLKMSAVEMPRVGSNEFWDVSTELIASKFELWPTLQSSFARWFLLWFISLLQLEHIGDFIVNTIKIHLLLTERTHCGVLLQCVFHLVVARSERIAWSDSKFDPNGISLESMDYLGWVQHAIGEFSVVLA